jgi:hypothetical protein
MYILLVWYINTLTDGGLDYCIGLLYC